MVTIVEDERTAEPLDAKSVSEIPFFAPKGSAYIFFNMYIIIVIGIND